MGAGAGPSQAVELEGVGDPTCGERRSRRLNPPSASAEDTAFAAGPGALGIVDDDAAPRQRAAADAGRHRVDDAILRLFHDRCGKGLVAQRGTKIGAPYRLLAHLAPLKADRDCFASLAMTTTRMSLRGARRRSNLAEAKPAKELIHGDRYRPVRRV